MIPIREEIAYDPWVAYQRHTGECVIPPGPITWDTSGGLVPERLYRHHRPKFHNLLSAQLEQVEVSIEYGMHVVDYYEDEASGKGGVFLIEGRKIDADLVIAADGVGTKSYKLVAGKKVEAKSMMGGAYLRCGQG